MSPITPAPTAKPGDAPIACTNRHDNSWTIVWEEATPKEPKKRRGIAIRYTGFLPSKTYCQKYNDDSGSENITEGRIGRAGKGAQRYCKH